MRYVLLESLLASALALVSCTHALAANPEWDQATRQYQQGDYKGALSGFQKIAEKMPRDPSVHYMLGQCYKSLNNTKQATSELEWVSKYATDPRIKNGAAALLGQLQAGSGTSGAVIPGAVSPYTANKAGASAQPVEYPPRKELINDSVAQTVSAAYQKGWIPCKGSECLTLGKPGWHHEHIEGYPDSMQWMSYTKDDGSTQWLSYLHIGELVSKNGIRKGDCPACHGSGWIKK